MCVNAVLPCRSAESWSGCELQQGAGVDAEEERCGETPDSSSRGVVADGEQRVAAVQVGDEKHLDEHLGRLPGEEMSPTRRRAAAAMFTPPPSVPT